MWTLISNLLTPTSLFIFLNLTIATIVLISRFTSHQKPHQLGPYDSPQLVRAPSLIDRVKSINFSTFKFPTPESDFTQLTEPSEFPHPVDSPSLARSPSLIDRVKSINFSLYKFPTPNPEPEETHPEFTHRVEPPPLTRAPSLLERVKSINLSSFHRSEQLNPETELHARSEWDSSPGSGPNHSVEHFQVKRSKSETTKSPAKPAEKMTKSASEKSKMVRPEEEEQEEAEIVERRRPATARIERTVTVGDGDHAVDARADDFINRFKQQLKLQRLDSLLRRREKQKG